MEWWHVKAEQKGVAVCRPIKSGSTRFLSKPETASRKPSPETIRCFTIIRHLGTVNDNISTTWNQELFWLASLWPSSIYLMRSRRPESLQVLSLTGVAQSRTSKLVFCLVFFVSCAKEHKTSCIDWGTPKNWMSDKNSQREHTSASDSKTYTKTIKIAKKTWNWSYDNHHNSPNFPSVTLAKGQPPSNPPECGITDHFTGCLTALPYPSNTTNAQNLLLEFVHQAIVLISLWEYKIWQHQINDLWRFRTWEPIGFATSSF